MSIVRTEDAAEMLKVSFSDLGDLFLCGVLVTKAGSSEAAEEVSATLELGDLFASHAIDQAKRDGVTTVLVAIDDPLTAMVKTAFGALFGKDESIASPGSKPEPIGISARTARKWLNRFDEHGLQGLMDRSSRPARTRTTLDEPLSQRIEQLRRQRMPMRRIAAVVGRSVATISRFLATLGLSSLKALEPLKPVVRYEKDAPGQLLHMDTKKLGRIERPSHRVTGDRRDATRGAGWEFAHVAIDDHSRAGFVRMHVDERKTSAVDFLKAAVAHYAALGVKIERLLTDNGSAYRSRLFNQTCQALGIKHIFTKPYRPQTNGKAERFIQTCLREWAYGRTWNNSAERTAWLPAFLAYYNARRPHSALGHKPPASRLGGNNLLQLNI